MADVDDFGLRRGSKVSKAASLAARPQGATMAEIVARHASPLAGGVGGGVPFADSMLAFG
jgi:hypothetical protein